MGGAARRRHAGQGPRTGQAALGAAKRNQATGTAEPGPPAPGAAGRDKPGPAPGTAAARNPCARGASADGGARRPARGIQDTGRSQATGAAKNKHSEAAHREQAAGTSRGTAAEAGAAEARHDRPTESRAARTRKGQGRQGGRKTLRTAKRIITPLRGGSPYPPRLGWLHGYRGGKRPSRPWRSQVVPPGVKSAAGAGGASSAKNLHDGPNCSRKYTE